MLWEGNQAIKIMKVLGWYDVTEEEEDRVRGKSIVHFNEISNSPPLGGSSKRILRKSSSVLHIPIKEEEEVETNANEE